MFTHTFKYTDGTGVSYYLQGIAVWPSLHIFKCRHHTYVYILFFNYSLYVGLSFTGKLYYFCGSNGATFKPKIRDSQILIRD